MGQAARTAPVGERICRSVSCGAAAKPGITLTFGGLLLLGGRAGDFLG
jgi:hypothetical protein